MKNYCIHLDEDLKISAEIYMLTQKIDKNFSNYLARLLREDMDRTTEINKDFSHIENLSLEQYLKEVIEDITKNPNKGFTKSTDNTIEFYLTKSEYFRDFKNELLNFYKIHINSYIGRHNVHGLIYPYKIVVPNVILKTYNFRKHLGEQEVLNNA